MFFLDLLVHAIRECVPPDPAELMVNSAGADSQLRAAGLWDRHGEWERAVALYGLAAELLRGRENGAYAENCRKEVQGKIDRSKGN